jgi:hypothetical protein
LIILAILAASAVLQGWTWTLYEGEGPLVLANEIPDTPQLRTVLECEPGSGVARLDLYGGEIASGFATLSSGSATATGQTTAGAGRQSVAVRTDHPAFGQFMLTGALDVAVAQKHREVQIEPAHLAKLRRFAELCAG